MAINKIYKTITFTAIISLNLATASSSVKAATLTLTSQSGEIKINSNLTIEELDSNILSVSGNNPGVLTVDNSDFTGGSIILTTSSNLITPGRITPVGGSISLTGSSGSLTPVGGSISLTGSSGSLTPVSGSSDSISPSGGNVSISPSGGNVNISTGVLKLTTTSAQAIPEPTSLTSFAILGLGGLLLRLKKINRNKRA
jgi:hypothetical protein